MFGLGVCCASLAACFLIIYLDSHTSRLAAGVKGVGSMSKSERKVTRKVIRTHTANETERRTSLIESERQLLNSSFDPPLAVDANDNTIITSVDYEFRSNSDNPDTIIEDGYESEEFDDEDETVQCTQIQGLSLHFWILCFATVILYG